MKFAGITTFALLASAAFAAEPKWIRVPSSDFEIFSTASQGDTLRVLQYFERTHSFFAQSTGSDSKTKTDPVRIIVFGSKKEFEPYRPNDFTIAFYNQIAGRDYIVLGGLSDDVFPIAVHEYVHLVAQHGNFNLPPWLNEGLAEVFSTIKPLGDKVIVGGLIPGRMYQMSVDKWVPLSTILAADHNSPYYNEKSKAGSLYNEGWAFAHMLELTPEYSPRFTTLLEALRTGTPSQQAVETVYGKPLAVLDKELQAYLRQDRFAGAVVTLKMRDGGKATTEPAPMFDVKMALLDLQNRPGREVINEKGLVDLAAEYPQRPEPHSALAYLAWRSGHQDQALVHFKAALDRGADNPQMLWDYGRMAGGPNPQEAVRALTSLLAAQPGRVDVRLSLGQIELNVKRPQDAIDTLSPITKILPADAPKLFRILAYANMQIGEPETARNNAQRWLDNTKVDAERASATQLLKYLDALKQAPARGALQISDAAQPVTDRPLPQLIRRGSDDPPSPAEAQPRLRLNTQPRPSVAGTFVDFNCEAGHQKFVIKTDEGLVSFLMDDPKLVMIRGRATETIDLYCGAQKDPALVWVEYDPPPATPAGLKGIARFIHFEPPGSRN